MGSVTRAAGLLACAVAAAGGLSPKAAQDGDLDGIGFVLGSSEAPVRVVEFGDFACSACAQFTRDVWPTLRERYVDTGLVQWRMIPFELGFRNSEEGARAGQCAAEQDMFWPMHDALYEQQRQWTGLRRPAETLLELAGSAGLDQGRFWACYDDDRRKEETRRANRAARGHGVRGTPTFLIGEVRLQWAHPLEVFVQVLEAQLREGSGSLVEEEARNGS